MVYDSGISQTHADYKGILYLISQTHVCDSRYPTPIGQTHAGYRGVPEAVTMGRIHLSNR